MSLVVVEIAKTTFQSCTVDTKAEVLAPAPNPIGQALAVLSPFIGVAGRAPARVAAPSGAEALDRQLASLEADATSSLQEVNTERQTARDTLLSLRAMLACTAKPATTSTSRATRLASVRSAVAGVVDAVAAPVAILSARAAALNKAVIEKVAKPGEETWSQDALGRIDRIQRTLDAIADRRTAIGKARDALSPVLERIDTYTPSTTAGRAARGCPRLEDDGDGQVRERGDARADGLQDNRGRRARHPGRDSSGHHDRRLPGHAVGDRDRGRAVLAARQTTGGCRGVQDGHRRRRRDL